MNAFWSVKMCTPTTNQHHHFVTKSKIITNERNIFIIRLFFFFVYVCVCSKSLDGRATTTMQMMIEKNSITYQKRNFVFILRLRIVTQTYKHIHMFHYSLPRYLPITLYRSLSPLPLCQFVSRTSCHFGKKARRHYRRRARGTINTLANSKTLLFYTRH